MESSYTATRVLGMNIDVFWNASLAIQVHIVVAALAVLFGAMQLTFKKGTWVHRQVGRFWVILMAAVALTSFFIHEIRVWGLWSPIHLLSIFTLGTLFIGVYAARQKQYRTHAITMSATYFLALILTGALTLLPGRVMHGMVFG